MPSSRSVEREIVLKSLIFSIGSAEISVNREATVQEIGSNGDIH